MKLGSHLSKLAIAALALSLQSAPAAADVKAGVDAWSRGDYEAAVKEWREPALKGDPDAQFNMGQAYKTGRGVKTDLNIALDWYKKAAAQGHLKAMDSYGHLLHYQGRVPEALPILQASADRGDPRAQYLLATELFNGTHIAKDWVRAYALMSLASSAGMAPASQSLSQMDKYVPLEQRQAATVLAGDLEQRASRNASAQAAGFPINTSPPAKPTKEVAVPPSAIPSANPPGFPANIPAVGVPAAKPKATTPVAVKPAAAPAPKTATPAAASPWRIQLGAFGEDANARKLWASLKGKVAGIDSLQPTYKNSGQLTRLQAGPFASRAAADEMCGKLKAAGQACLVVPG
ncbi:SPOR domain-containing protein [Sphingorhabdus contaminans]|uniref:SPOR domain-containing protein n=1 Tax=Sphingorhabdus contaminans TaxID=1343899 RepID=UPI003D2BF9FA